MYNVLPTKLICHTAIKEQRPISVKMYLVSPTDFYFGNKTPHIPNPSLTY